jgi:hypothetical protein
MDEAEIGKMVPEVYGVIAESKGVYCRAFGRRR